MKKLIVITLLLFSTNIFAFGGEGISGGGGGGGLARSAFMTDFGGDGVDINSGGGGFSRSAIISEIENNHFPPISVEWDGSHNPTSTPRFDLKVSKLEELHNLMMASENRNIGERININNFNEYLGRR